MSAFAEDAQLREEKRRGSFRFAKGIVLEIP